ncbi:pentapeptide repeat-containing protein [Streptomyces silvisoli]|uniref:Pentapeptide repeat-containing protein n=1 Tax=Streptomyces silvisoli TaxID=3034235 RepID=A0ABT5ZR48_9ACTN|nr:pentapeptide repeat-containing protein [Streptomyces silvisoli]MDF3292267.1 pentapeptide repeat-containing protein [Streptomyces silvisoli]
METRSFGQIDVILPGLGEPGVYLSNVTSLEGGRGTVQDFHYADADLRELDLSNAQLLSGRVTGLRAQRTRLHDVRVASVEFDSSDFGPMQWTDSKLSRVVFRNCKLMGAALSSITAENVLLDNCKLDYATFNDLRATGPLVFSKCVLSEATFTNCDLSRTVFDDCTLRLTEFARGKYQGCDLRGNDLATLRGVAELRKVIIDRSQQAQLAEALTAELDVTYGEDLGGRR